MKSSNPLKILVIPSWYPPDGGYFFREHAVALSEKGYKVDVLAGINTSLKTLRPKNVLSFFKAEILEIEGITEYRKKYKLIPFCFKPNATGWIKMMLGFFDWYLKKNGKPHIVLAHSSIWAGVVAERINQKYGIPYIITEHRSRFVNNMPEANKMFKPWFFPLLKNAFSNANAVVTVSNSLQPFIKEIAPACAENVQTIFNMVDTEFFAPQKIVAKNERFTFFSLGNLEKVKGFDILINAFSFLPKEKQQAMRLIIGGDGSERNFLERLVAQKGLGQFITFTGKLSKADVLRNYQQADAFVLASNFEAFGVVYIEAMSCGLPVIATKAGGPQGFIGAEQGILVQPGNAGELAQTMERIMLAPQSFDTQKIRNYAKDNFGQDAIASQYVRLFEKILKPAK